LRIEGENTMKVAILAGGFGTRLAEETDLVPKPMVQIGGNPILWHIMSHYGHFGFQDFYIALGYRGDVIKKYFLNYYTISSRNLRISLSDGAIDSHKSHEEEWVVNLIDTGLNTGTGGRIKRLEPWLNDGTFMATYGDGVCNVNLQKLLAFHKQHGKIATMTVVHPPARFGDPKLEDDLVVEFSEKPQIVDGWINGGFFIFEPQIFDYLDGDSASLERDALHTLARERQLAAYRHTDFCQCMDTLRDKRYLQRLWDANHAPWKVWAQPQPELNGRRFDDE
jgi:glucose-1-phosphate cytidylyltransferase